MTFCTLFDSYYLDKGIALYRSLERCARDQFTLYIFCFDDKSYDILESMHLSNAVLVKSKVLENDCSSSRRNRPCGLKDVAGFGGTRIPGDGVVAGCVGAFLGEKSDVQRPGMAGYECK